MPKQRSLRNKTLVLSEEEQERYRQSLLRLAAPASVELLRDQIICQDVFEAAPYLPEQFVDLLIVDPPYNLTKQFGEHHFQQRSDDEYAAWTEKWLSALRHTLKPNASVYVCGDWRTSAILYNVLRRHFIIRNRITWARDKGRGAKMNWKNNAEDIWFCTVGQDYYFDVESVKVRRKVIAPYRTEDGAPKDWLETEAGNFRLTHPSNIWTDLTVPFWSMPENTEHPAQKPEKLIAKLVLASSAPNALVLDPFLGSGTTAVVARKLGRQFVGIEIDALYCCIAQKRLYMAESDPHIQGYEDGVFLERNTSSKTTAPNASDEQLSLFMDG
jgi:site-specific DNA-methyltransferase (adenine-specific)